MFLALDPPIGDDLLYFELACSSSSTRRKVREVLEGVRPQVSEATREYRRSLPEYRVVAPASLSDLERKTLRNLYERLSTQGHSSGLRVAILQNPSNQTDTCAYCGVGLARQIDHYLPKSDYPEYSVLAANLVPVCSDCNWFKGEEQAPVDSRFPHPYFDYAVLASYVKASVTWSDSKSLVSFSLDRPAEMSQQQFDGIAALFSTLKLERRYIREGVLEIEAQGFQDLAGIPAMRETLTRTAERTYERLLGTLGPNHWRTALYRGLSQSTFAP